VNRDPFVRHSREALDLTTLAVALWRGGAGRPALLAAVDQARASLLAPVVDGEG
jgi:hypothetical protein